MFQWQKKVDRSENSKRRKDREAKSRELYEKIFPELRKQREDKERDHRLGTRGTVRSEAEVEDVIERIQEQEVSRDFFLILYVQIRTLWCQIVHMGGIKTSWVFFVKPQPE